MVDLPNDTQHIAIAGMTGSGKTWGALEMLSMRDFDKQAWIIIDHKRDENILKLPAERINPNTMILPKSGLYLVLAEMNEKSRAEIEALMKRCFERGGIGFYVDEGHLMPKYSEAVRTIMVAGRSRRVPMMWTSQRAHHIDTFIWAQSLFYRCFTLQGPPDIKRFNEHFPRKYIQPEEFHSYYFDIAKNKMSYLHPSAHFDVTLARFRDKLVRNLRAI